MEIPLRRHHSELPKLAQIVQFVPLYKITLFDFWMWALKLFYQELKKYLISKFTSCASIPWRHAIDGRFVDKAPFKTTLVNFFTSYINSEVGTPLILYRLDT